MDLDAHLQDKQTAHGEFIDAAEFSQSLKMLMRQGRNWNVLSSDSKEALENVATLIARILIGDPCDPKHWNNAAGFMRLRGAAIGESVETSVTRLVGRFRPRHMTALDEEHDGGE